MGSVACFTWLNKTLVATFLRELFQNFWCFVMVGISHNLFLGICMKHGIFAFHIDSHCSDFLRVIEIPNLE